VSTFPELSGGIDIDNVSNVEVTLQAEKGTITAFTFPRGQDVLV
jgi:hypothetical protein